MHDNAHKMLKKLASGDKLTLEQLAQVLQSEAKKLLAEKGGPRSAAAATQQASSLARNHLRPLIREGYVRRVGRGQYEVTASGTLALSGKAKKKVAKKKVARKKVAKKKPVRKKLARKKLARKKPARKKLARKKGAGASLHGDLARLQAHLQQLATWVQKVRSRLK